MSSKWLKSWRSSLGARSGQGSLREAHRTERSLAKHRERLARRQVKRDTPKDGETPMIGSAVQAMIEQRMHSKGLGFMDAYREVMAEDNAIVRAYSTYDALTTLPDLIATMRGVTAGLTTLTRRGHAGIGSLLARSKLLLQQIAAAGRLTGPTREREVWRLTKSVMDLKSDTEGALQAPLPATRYAYEPPTQAFGPPVSLAAEERASFGGLVFGSGRHG